MNKNLYAIKDNIRNIYKNQRKKIKNLWEWKALWSYMDRLIKIQVNKKNLDKAIRYNDKLFNREITRL